MSKRSIKILVAIGGFALGFLLFSFMGFNSIPATVRIVIHCILVLILVGVIVGISIYMHKYNKVRLYNELVAEAKAKELKPKLIELGIDKSLIEVDIKDDSIQIRIKHKGFYASLIAKEGFAQISFQPTDEFNKLSEIEKEKIEALMDNRRAGKELLKLSCDEIYRELQAFNTLAI